MEKKYQLKQCQYYPVSEMIIDSLERYLNNGIMPGGFLTACLENNLREALGRADEFNRATIFNIVHYLHNYIPSSAWGSPDHIEYWLEQFKEKAA